MISKIKIALSLMTFFSLVANGESIVVQPEINKYEIKHSLLIVSNDNEIQSSYESCVHKRREYLNLADIHYEVKKSLINNAGCYCVNALKIKSNSCFTLMKGDNNVK